MNHTQTSTPAVNESTVDEGMDLIESMIVLAKHKKRIIRVTLGCAVMSALISFAIPNVYKATTKILPPQQAQSGAAALLAQLGGVAGAAAGVSGIKNPNDLYIGMLKSRTIADKLIARYDLRKAYDIDSLEKARKKLEGNTTIVAGKDGLIAIDVEDENQDLVAQLTNSYAEELLKLTKVLAVTEASQRRLFFERQLELAKTNLAAAEMLLKGALEKNGVISVDSDSRAIVETIARLRAQISAKEISLAAMQAFVTTQNQDYKRTQQELSGLRAEVFKLQNGRPDANDALTVVSDRGGLENIKILRDVKYHQMLYELLSKQYEVARLDEAKDASIIQVLDSALKPERKFKPQRAIIVSLATLLGLFASIAWAFFIEAREKSMTLPERAAQWSTLKKHLSWRPLKDGMH